MAKQFFANIGHLTNIEIITAFVIARYVKLKHRLKPIFVAQATNEGYSSASASGKAQYII